MISVGLLMGSIYFNLEPGDVRNRVAGMSMYIAFVSFMTFDILMLWPAERSIYLRDQISGMYCTSAFYTARSFAEAPTHMLCGAIGRAGRRLRSWATLCAAGGDKRPLPRAG